jgi:hypothetical protein
VHMYGKHASHGWHSHIGCRSPWRRGNDHYTYTAAQRSAAPRRVRSQRL